MNNCHAWDNHQVFVIIKSIISQRQKTVRGHDWTVLLLLLLFFWRASVWNLIYLLSLRKIVFDAFLPSTSHKHIVIWMHKTSLSIASYICLYWVTFSFTLCCSWCLRMRRCLLLPVYVGIGLTGLSSKYFRVWLDTELLDPIVFHCIGKYIL